MKSKTWSCDRGLFSAGLFRKNLSRFWPLWGMASFLGLLMPLAVLFQKLRYPELVIQPLEVTAGYYDILAYAVPIVSLCYAILCAMTVWSYLYSPRSVSMMHTLPIRRSGLFVTNFLSGMAMMLIPYVVTGAMCVLLTLIYSCFEPVGLLVTVLGVLGDSFFYFSTATLAAFCVGNIFALPAVYFLLHFLAVMLDWLLSTFAQGYLFGLTSSYSGTVEFLSPTVYLLDRVNVDRTWQEVQARTALTNTGYFTSGLAEVTLRNFWLIGVYALVGVALLTLAWALYAHRRSESAGDVVAVGWMKPVFRFGLAALAALLGGQLLYALFWSSFQDGQYYDSVPLVVCMLVAGTIGYYGSSMLLAKSLRVFRRSWMGLAAVALGCIALCGILRFDVLNIAGRVPELNSVKEVRLDAAGNSYTLYPGEDNAVIEQIRQLHQTIVADEDYIRSPHSWDIVTPDGGGENAVTFTYLTLVYEFTGGGEVRRSYDLPLTRERLVQEGTYDNLLDRLINDEDMKTRRLHAGDSRYTVEGGYLYCDVSESGYDLNSREAASVLEAAAKDAADGTWGTYDWFNEDSGGDYAIDLELQFSYADESTRSSNWITIRVRPGMENTVACLKELGLVTDRDLVTYAELDDREFALKYGGVPTEILTETEAAAIGIIGGADGPTETFVTEAVG
ncbi:ABC transporter permease [Dysosmobacter sp. HCP28S3_G4]|uniref:ABC transporter permease n=1 Tax=Dysosmobacter sp. HCP28S3_G4 TaxID=3438938 RepID=UPI003F8BE40F